MRTCKEFVADVNRCCMAMLNNIVTIDEAMECHHMPESSFNSGSKKGRPGPSRQMLLAFFNSKCLMYTCIVHRGATVNSNNTRKASDKFPVHLQKKRTEMAQQECCFSWDNTPPL
jgi:hypothetical protein